MSRPVYTAYVPHGIPSKYFYPIDEKEDKEYSNFKTSYNNHKQRDFIIFWNNRNIRRKQAGDLILAYRKFCDSLSKKQAAKVTLIMHTAIKDPNGTDLKAVKDAVCPDYDIDFSTNKQSVKNLNMLYNLADVTVNIASNEGFGLSGAESLMAGTPIINNVTGGLQDQCRFEDEQGRWIDFSTEFSSNHVGKYRKHGPWVKPVYPTNRSLQGSIPTPYIFDDRCDFNDVASALRYWYDMTREERKELGNKGREWLLSEECGMSAKEMGNRFKKHIKYTLKVWKPRKPFSFKKVTEPTKVVHDGITW